ncbi:MAG: CAP domain-containing protein, partial [Myxococcaceae bacterium]
GLPKVEADEALDAVAQAYSDQLAAENFFAHVAPDGADLRARLTRAGYRYQSAGENLGLAVGPLAAHFGIEHSPGHRKNLLDSGFTRIGVGVTFKRLEDRTQVLVTEVLAAPAGGEQDAGAPLPLDAAYTALSRARSALKLPALQRSLPLEEVAGEHLRRALELDEPKTRLPGFSTSDRVFAALDDVASASVDLFIAESPQLVSDSKNLADPRNDRVGVAVKRTDSAKYGKDHFWVVVIYASPR